LEVTVPVLFQAAFAGSKNLLVFAQGGASLGPTSKGSWTVPAGGSPASVVSVQPPAASGAGGVFTVQVVDAQGAADLSYGYLLINKTYDTAASCTVVVDHQWKVLYLGNDQMTAWLTVGLGENKTVENSQCRVKGATSKMTLAGSMATYQLDLQFTSRNSGVNTLWADAVDKGGAGLGYGAYGSYDVKIPVATLSLPSPSPASGQGNVERFRFTADHTSGAALVTESAFSISPGSTPAGGCTVRFVSSSGLLQLADSTGAYKWSVRPGTTDVAAGPVCTLYGAGSSVVKSGTAVNSTVALVFPATFAGAKFLLQSATGGTTLPWQVQGNWTVLSGTAPPGVLRMAPSAPNGTRIIVDLILADAQGVTDLAFGYGLIHSALANPNGCMFLADRAWKAVYLLNDAGTAWTSAFLGENKVLENSQCRIFPATSTQATLGNALRYSIDIAFKPGFAGEKKVWASAVDAGMVSSGWIEFGAFQAQ
jgi:hypothetical protein